MVYESYEYRYMETPRPDLLQLMSIGHQSVSKPGYAWDGMKRDGGGVIFQYTLSGEGSLAYGSRIYKVTKGSAFLVTVPGQHRYYYDSSSEEDWEFVWIRLSGAQASAIWKEWLESEGVVSEFRMDSETIVRLMDFYESASSGALGDMWDISVKLYEWLLTLLKRKKVGQQTQRDIPETYARIAAWMDIHYAEDISLEQLAEHAGVTKHHFCKKFYEYYHTTPIQYLRRKRIEEAALLLRRSRIPIKDIAARCGYADLGYFGKVFHQLVGVSPSNFRNTDAIGSGDALKLL